MVWKWFGMKFKLSSPAHNPRQLLMNLWRRSTIRKVLFSFCERIAVIHSLAKKISIYAARFFNQNVWRDIIPNFARPTQYRTIAAFNQHTHIKNTVARTEIANSQNDICEQHALLFCLFWIFLVTIYSVCDEHGQ